MTETTVNMMYVTHRTLKTSSSKIIPKSGRVKVSLRVPDERWKHRLGQWNPDTRTFTEVSLLIFHLYNNCLSVVDIVSQVTSSVVIQSLLLIANCLPRFKFKARKNDDNI